MQRIKGYHAHVYFDASTLDQARELCELAATTFALQMGRMHQRPVGPHPDWSCQLAFEAQYIGVPPRSTLFPYTTLFRSGRSSRPWDLDGGGQAVGPVDLPGAG